MEPIDPGPVAPDALTPAAQPVGRALATAPRYVALAVVFAAYLLGLVSALVTWAALGSGHPVVLALCADVVATVVVFAVSTVVNNASVYDPYWSVAPPLIALAWVWYAAAGVAATSLF